MPLSPADAAKLQAARDALSREDAPRCLKPYRPDTRYTDQDECAQEAGHDGGCGPRAVLGSMHLRNVLAILDGVLTEMNPGIEAAVARRIAKRIVLSQDTQKPPKPSGPRICACGNTDCTWTTDPYEADIHANRLWQYLCEGCLDERSAAC